MKARTFLGVCLDLILGLVAAFLLVGLAVAVHTIHNLVVAAFVAAGVVFTAALLRQLVSPANAWAAGIALGIGSLIPVLLVGVFLLSAGANLVLWLVALGFLLTAMAGAQAGAAVRGRGFLTAALALVVASACAWGMARIAQHATSVSSAPVSQDKPAPAFALTDASGQPISNASLKGHIVVLDFWATWCAPCLAEMPSVGRVRQRFQDNPQVLFYAVNPGWNEQSDDAVRAFAAKHGFAVPLAFDPAGKAIQSFGANSLPFIVILDARGNMRMTAFGFDSNQKVIENLTAKISELLAAS